MEKESLVVQAAQTGELSGAIGWVVGVVVSILTALVGLVWRKHNEEIDDLKKRIDTMTLRSDFDKHEERMRDAVIALHAKVEAASAELRNSIAANEHAATSRHIELLTALNRK